MAEEADAGTGHDRREDRGVDLAEGQSQHREGDARDRTDAGSEPVHAVEEVDHVHHRHDPDDRDRYADPRGKVDSSEEREREVVDPDAEGRGDRCREHLAGELRERRKPPEVVDRADDAGDGGAEQDPAHLAREVEERKRRHQDPHEDREPTEPRDRSAVEPPLAGVVDDPEEPRHPADRRCEQDDDQQSDRGAVQDLRIGPKRVHVTYFVP